MAQQRYVRWIDMQRSTMDAAQGPALLRGLSDYMQGYREEQHTLSLARAGDCPPEYLDDLRAELACTRRIVQIFRTELRWRRLRAHR
jgi:hypothetical protein